MAYTPHHKREPRQERERREWYENVTLGTAIAGVIVVAASTAVTVWMARIMEDQQEVMLAQQKTMEAQQRIMESQQRVMEAQQRPWVSVAINEKEMISLSWGKDNQPAVIADLIISNLGDGVATEVLARGAIWAGGSEVDLLVRQEKLCAQATKNAKAIGSLGGAVFPGQRISKTEMFEGEASQVAAGVRSGKINLIVYGCVTYKFTVSPSVQTTRFAFGVVKPRKDGLRPDMELRVGKDAFDPKVTMQRYMYGNQTAD